MNKDDEPLNDVNLYRKLVGKLLYLTITRSDISFVVQKLSQYMQDPNTSHLEDALRIVRYVKREPSKGNLLSSDSMPNLVGYCDQIELGVQKLGNQLQVFALCWVSH